MKKMHLALCLVLTVIGMTLSPVAARACDCPDPDGSKTQALLNNERLYVAEVYVRGMNPQNRQSMLQVKNVYHGAFFAQNIRAKFDGGVCGVIPRTGKTSTFVLRAEADGSYAIVGDCAHKLLTNYVKTHKE